MTTDFRLIGQGFDTVQVSLETWIPYALTLQFHEAQRIAKRSRKPIHAVLGPGGVEGEVLRHGGGGGDVIFSTGELNDMWFAKMDQGKDGWGVTVKVRSLALLCHGFEDSLSNVWQRANQLGLHVTGYSLGRVDYRFDILTDNAFAPTERCVMRHNRSVVRPYSAVTRRHPVWAWSDDPDARVVMRGKRIETLMIGTIGSGMQVVIYNKRSELMLTRNHTVLEAYGLDLSDPSWGLWRIEVRFSGDVLKRRLDVRTLEALRINLRPMLEKALTRVRYIEPSSIGLPSVDQILHPLWNLVTLAIGNATCSQPSQFAPERSAYLIAEEKKRALRANIAGCGLSLAAMQTSDVNEIVHLGPRLAREAVENALVVDPKKAARAVDRQWRSHQKRRPEGTRWIG